MTDALPLTVAGLQAKIDASPFNAGMGIAVTHADAEAEEVTMRIEMRRSSSAPTAPASITAASSPPSSTRSATMRWW